MYNKYPKNISLIVCAFLLISISISGCSSKSQYTSTPLFSPEEGIVSQGIVEAKEVSINTKIPGKINTLHIEEGDAVKAGDLLVEISSDELKAKEEQALAVIEAAKAAYQAAKGQSIAANAMLEKAENGARVQEIAQAQAYYDLMEKTYERVDKLFEKGAVSAQKRDEVKTQLEVTSQQLSIAQEGTRSEDKVGAQALVAQALAMEQATKGKLEQAEGALQEVHAYLKDTQIVSPISGVITVINADEGELVSTGMPIATVTDLSSPWVEVKVQETNLNQIVLGQQVSIKIPSFSDHTFTGKVVRINQKPDFATKRSTNDNGDFDILSFSVKIELDNTEKVLKPGMTAFVQFKK